jgi:hypothetical protein
MRASRPIVVAVEGPVRNVCGDLADLIRTSLIVDSGAHRRNIPRQTRGKRAWSGPHITNYSRLRWLGRS